MFCEIIRPHGARDARYIHHRTRRDRPLHAPRSGLQEDRAYDGRGDANARPLTATGRAAISATTDETIFPVFRRKYSFLSTLFRKSFSCIALAHCVWLRLLRGVATLWRLLPHIHRPDATLAHRARSPGRRVGPACAGPKVEIGMLRILEFISGEDHSLPRGSSKRDRLPCRKRPSLTPPAPVMTDPWR